MNSTELSTSINQAQTQIYIQRELIEMGFDISLINKIFNRFNILSLQQAVDFVVKIEGMWNHPFISVGLDNMGNKNSKDDESIICEICNDISIAHRSNFISNPNEIFKKREEQNKLTKTDSNILSKSCNSSQKSKEEFELNCEICLCEISDSYTLPCGEKFCKICIIDYIIYKINSSDVECIKCPNCKCLQDFIFDENMIELLVDQQIFEKYIKFKRRNSILKNPYLIICPIFDCESYAYKLNNELTEINKEIELKVLETSMTSKQLSTNLLSKNQQKTIYKCLNNHEFCIKCGQLAHSGIDCEKKIENEFFKYVDLENVKNCPKCGFFIKKSEGCNHMTCANKSCKNEFCWICLGDYSPNHYNNPLNGCLGLTYANDTAFLVKFKFFRYIRTLFYVFGVVLLFSLVFAFPSVAMAIGFMGHQGAENNSNFFPIVKGMKNALLKKFAKLILYSLYILLGVALLPLSYTITIFSLVFLPIICLFYFCFDPERFWVTRRRSAVHEE